jgi:type I restriction enzyme S subunit
MIDGLRPYVEMKPTGFEWLPALPVGWEIRRAKYSFKEADDRSETGGEELLSVSHKTGVTPRSQKNITMFMAESYEGHKVCRPGDIVVNTMWAWMAAIGVSRHDGIVSPAYGIYRPRTADRFEPKFLDYLLRTEVYRAEYLRSSRGVTTSRLRLYPPDFLNIPFVQPPAGEQRLIVRFLDWHGGQTAKLVRAKKKIIALLNEQKQAIIHRAVTRGLDPNVRLKPSGIPWLGDVPEGWEVKRLKQISRIRYGLGQPPAEKVGGLPLIRATNVDHGKILTKNLVFVDAESVPKSRGAFLKTGDIIVVRSGAYTADSAIIPPEYEGSVAGYDIVVTATGVLPAFLAAVLLAPHVQIDQLIPASMRAAQPHLNAEELGAAILAVPDAEAQVRIVADIDNETAFASKAIDNAQREMALIQEFRARLIADVVTGKLDVRALAASLPEVNDVGPIDDFEVGDDLDEAVDDVENEEAAA